MNIEKIHYFIALTGILVFSITTLSALDSKHQEKLLQNTLLKPDALGFTQLHWSAYNQDLPGLKTLIKNKAVIDARDEQEGATALHWACEKNNYALIQTLINARANLTALDHAGNTPLHWASRAGNMRAARLLVDNGAEINQKNFDGNTPLHLSLQNNGTEKDFDMPCYLAYNRADPNIPNESGDTALHLAIDSGNPILINCLLENNGDVTVLDKEGRSALKRALMQSLQKIDIITVFLLKHGADENDLYVIKDTKHRDVLIKAVEKFKENIKKKKDDVEKNLEKFRISYGIKPPSTSFYYLSQALKSAGIVPSLEIANLGDPKKISPDKKFNDMFSLVFVTHGSFFSSRRKTQTLFEQLYEKNLSDEEILTTIKPLAKLLSLHYKIHIMPRARKRTSSNTHLVDRNDAASLIEQVVNLYITDHTFRQNIENFKVMRTPQILYPKNEIGPFIVIYPRMRPGCALTVARILDEKLTFTKLDSSYPIHPVPRFNIKFNDSNINSGLFYTMGDGDFKHNKHLNKIIFEPNTIHLNEQIMHMAGIEAHPRLRPLLKRRMSADGGEDINEEDLS